MASQEQPAAFTIANAISEFLAHEQQRLSLKRLSRYRQVLELFQIYLDGYWPGETQEEYKRVTELDGTFCTWFGPERVLDGYSEFLGYYMGHKVYNSLETNGAAGTVMARFAEWLAERGYIASASSIVERSKRASRELPAAETACRILERSLAGA